MELIVCEGEEEFTRAVSSWCKTSIQAFSGRSLFIPAGKTPEALYSFWEETKPDYLEGVQLLQIDEVLLGSKQGLFLRFFEQYLPSYMNAFQAISSCEQVADLAILGLGLNGHVAFHEPDIDLNFCGGCVKLSAKTCQNLGIAPGSWGLSYGVGAFLKAKAILIIVRGESKKDILKRVLAREKGLPAAALLDHPHVKIITDRAAMENDEFGD